MSKKRTIAVIALMIGVAWVVWREPWVEEGDSVARKKAFHSDFVLVVPKDDKLLLERDGSMRLWGAYSQPGSKYAKEGDDIGQTIIAEETYHEILKDIGSKKAKFKYELKGCPPVQGKCYAEKGVFQADYSPPLFEPIFYNRFGGFMTLLEKGEDIEKRDGYDRTALMLAVYYNRPQMVRVLLDRGADVNARDAGGNPVLAMALKNIDIMLALLKNKADPNVADNGGRTPLYYAVYFSMPDETIVVLMEAGADLDRVLAQWPFNLKYSYNDEKVKRAVALKESLKAN